ncbi:hypothetical protein PAAG_03901 [Paracoccidioides lutzii Pb01]|uniref:DUF1753 domain-containing protein n=1 Tax=Paracoccidioides lutzii (strain ATCC MYA-826 / Pb01) TaxID=502779 RepID=C1GZF7_PARBA|nr:hypothetical protein PAAG_03901 [Paracoccidioides lutzii Pb01]EEH41980.2 hypothetical protein PAAG_03901 [Paracoccidioides lutzii Pb01]
MSLQTGATVITLSLLLNKISGLYGLLALLTGYHLSPFQLSMYIYSILGLALTAFLAPHIRLQSPLQCLALAWFYLLDSVINAAYTAAFAVTWFLVISQHHEPGSAASGPGSSMMGETAGFITPKLNVSSVLVDGSEGSDVSASSQPSSTPTRTSSGAQSGSASLGNAVLQPESLQSIGIICTLWTIRVYFVFVMLSFARHCILQHSFHARTSVSRRRSLHTHSRNTSLISNIDIDPNPFNIRSPEGQGWKGKLGRIMVSVGRNYWLEDDDHGWLNGMNRKFRKSVDPVGSRSTSGSGLSERERRRRSGTGPPLPSQTSLLALIQQQQQQQQPHHSRSQSQVGQSVKMHDISEGRRQKAASEL